MISLPPNRSDSEEYNNKTNVINAVVKSVFAKDKPVFICDNSNLSYRGQPIGKHFTDGVHLTPSGEAMLFDNIRLAVEEVLRN